MNWSLHAVWNGVVLTALLLCAQALFGADVGGSWTNRAGHVLRATPSAISGGKVTFVQTGTGKSVSYPLSIFLPSEQERLRCCLKDTTLPEGLKDTYEYSARIVKRSRLLLENGDMSEKESQESRDKAVAAFRARAESFVAQKQLSPERLELVVRELSELKEARERKP